ncbi:MAG: hypothetical protein Q7R85_01035 [bacterium]|nr:hypothetical protein [bacterium]
MSLRKITITAGLLLAVGIVTSVANATHSWNGFHWGRTANPFTLQLGDNMSSTWDAYLGTAATNWSASNVLDTVVVSGKTKPRVCKPTNGRVEVCNERYGANGWLGIAQVWVSGEHIVQGAVKMNDSYFRTSTYNTPAWKNLVVCQEIGHTLGLDHQDEIFDNANLGTCMDYTNNPSANQFPNLHDYEQLEAIYTHLDTVNTVLSSGSATAGQGKPEGVGRDIDESDPSAWGQVVRRDAKGNASLYARDLSNGEKLFTFVTWAQ